MTLKEKIMKLQTYKMFEGEDTVYVERENVLGLLEQEPCEDAVSRTKVLEALNSINGTAELDRAFELIEKLPPVMPIHKKGKWITKTHGYPPEPTTVCSECGFDRDYYIQTRGFDKIKICPNCGAEMEEV